MGIGPHQWCKGQSPAAVPLAAVVELSGALVYYVTNYRTTAYVRAVPCHFRTPTAGRTCSSHAGSRNVTTGPLPHTRSV